MQDLESTIESFEKALEQMNPFQLLDQIFDQEMKALDEVDSKKTFYDVKNSNKQTEEIGLNEKKKLIFNEIMLKLDSKVTNKNFLILNLEGTGLIDVSIFDGGEIKSLGSIVNKNNKEKIYVVFETYFFRHY